MSDEIVQELGFSADKALSTLATLDQAMHTFENRLGSSAKTIKTFNTAAGKEVSALKLIGDNAKYAADQLERLNKAMGEGTTTAATSRRATTTTVTPNQTQQQLLTGQSAANAMNQFVASAQAAQARQSQTVWQRWSANVRSAISSVTSHTTSNANATQAAANRTKSSLDKITVSWETLVRVVATQAIVRALSTMRNALKAAVAEAAEFERHVAEIRTISAVKNVKYLSSALSDLSSEFNTPLQGTATAVYDIISDQIADGAQAMEFFTSSAKLAKIGIASIDDSANLLSGTVNALELNMKDADAIAAKFFKTIDIGRTTASELAGSFGEVAPLAHQLGITLDELGAAYATVTIAGINTAKTSTQLKGVLTGLVKPTKDMAETLRKLGFESGEEIIAAYGLGETLKVLAQQTDGTSAALAKLFPRVRGLTAALLLGVQANDKYASNLREVESASQGLLNREYDLFMTTNAESVTKDLNKLKNFFTTEFGEGILEATNKTFKFIGGVDTLIDGFQAVGEVGPKVVAVLGLIGVGLAATSLRAKMLSAEATLLNRSLAGIGLAASAALAGDYIGKRIATSMQNASKASQAALDKLVKVTDIAQREIAAAEQSRFDKLIQLQLQALAKKKALYLQDVDNYRASYQRFVDVTESALKRVVNAYQNVAQKQFDVARKANDLIKASNQSVFDSRRNLDDRIFQMQVKQRDEQTQYNRLMERASMIARKAASDLAKAGSASDLDKARELALAEFERARSFQEEAAAISESNAKLGLQNRTISEMKRLQDRLVQGEEQYQTALKESSAEAHKRGIVMTQSGVKTLEQLQTQIAELLKPVNDPKQLAANRAQAEKLVNEFLRVARGANLTPQLDFSDVKQQLRDEVHGVDIEVIGLSTTAMAEFERQVQDAVSRFELQTTIKGIVQLESAAGMQVTTPVDALAAIGKAKENMKAIREETNVLNSYLLRTKETAEKVREAMGRVNTAVFQETSTLPTGPGGVSVAIQNEQEIASKKELLTLQQDIIAASQKEALTRAEVLALTERAKELNASSASGLADWWAGGGLGVSNVNAIAEALNALAAKAAQFEASGIGPTVDIQARLAALKADMQVFDEYEVSLRNGLTALQQQELSSRNIAENLERAARSQAQSRADFMLYGSGKFMGGPMKRFASGGYARGLDTVPAMLTAGEFVTNARSSRRFFSQLQAINAGQQPAYRNTGGSVTNTGDVSITVNDSGSPQQTAREVMRAIRRESRRGASRI